MSRPETSEATYQKACDLVVEMRKATDEWDLSDGEECAGLAGTISWWLDAALREAGELGAAKEGRAQQAYAMLATSINARADRAEAELSVAVDLLRRIESRMNNAAEPGEIDPVWEDLIRFLGASIV